MIRKLAFGVGRFIRRGGPVIRSEAELFRLRVAGL